MYNPQLETFLRAADAGSFKKAAEQAYITPTAVIKQINLLEASLGVQLFERTHRGLTLTKAGVSLYQDAKYIIKYCRDSVIRAKNAMQEDENIIRIGTSPMTPAQTLVELWPKIHALFPEMKFQFVPYDDAPRLEPLCRRASGRYLAESSADSHLDFECHQMEHQLGAYTNCNHGEGLAVLHPVYYRHICENGSEKFARFAVNVWGIAPEGKTKEELVLEALADFIREIGLSTTLRELGVDEDTDLKAIADSCAIVPGMTQDEILNIFKECC